MVQTGGGAPPQSVEVPCCGECGRDWDEIAWSHEQERHLCLDCVTGTTDERERLNPPYEGERSTAPFDRDVDQLLAGLRWQCQPDPYRLIPGERDEPDRWRAKCPLHPDFGFSLLITEQQNRKADLWCRVGCPEGAIRYILVPDPDREREAERRTAVLLWAQSLQNGVTA